MALTFLQSQTAVGELINQAVTGDTETVTLSSVKRNLNLGYRMVNNAVVQVDPYFNGQISTADLVANQKYYSSPSQLKKLIRLEIGYTSATERYRARLVSQQSLPQADEIISYPTTEPVVQTFGNNLMLNPIPTQNVTDGLRFFYIKGVVDLSSNTDTYNLPDGYEHLPIMYAVAKSKYALGLESEAQAGLNEFYQLLGIMKAEIFDRVSSMGNSSIVNMDPY